MCTADAAAAAELVCAYRRAIAQNIARYSQMDDEMYIIEFTHTLRWHGRGASLSCRLMWYFARTHLHNK